MDMKRLPEPRFQFLGTQTIEYLTHIKPLIAMTNCWLALMYSAGFLVSPMFANVMSHLQVGAQKKIVKGPAGWRSKLLKEVGHGTFITRC